MSATGCGLLVLWSGASRKGREKGPVAGLKGHSWWRVKRKERLSVPPLSGRFTIVQRLAGVPCTLSLWNSRFSQWYGRVTAGCTNPIHTAIQQGIHRSTPATAPGTHATPHQCKIAGQCHAGKYDTIISHIAIVTQLFTSADREQLKGCRMGAHTIVLMSAGSRFLMETCSIAQSKRQDALYRVFCCWNGQ